MGMLLPRLLTGRGSPLGDSPWHIREPDHVEHRDALTLQVWGHEGYWHIVDKETEELIKAVSRPVTTNRLLETHPRWREQRDLVVTTLTSISRGLSQSAKPETAQVENVSINVTNACNLHCATCYVPERDRCSAKIDSAAAIKFLEKLSFSRSATISILGGEPFLHPQAVLDLARWAQTKGLGCNVSTNGTVPIASWAQVMSNSGLRVQVSIDGATALTNDQLRGVGTFHRALGTARELIAAGVHTTLCMVACGENQAKIPAYLRLAKEIGANEVRIIPLKRLGNAMNGGPTPTPQLQVLRTVAAEIERDPSLEELCQTDLYAVIGSMVRESSRRRSCGSGAQTLLLQADGSIYPCINSTLPEAKLGTLDGETGGVLQKGGRWAEALSVERVQHPCYPCAVKRWCLGGCPGESIQRHGTLKSPHWNCADLKESILFMMWQSARARNTSSVARTRI